MTCYLLFVQSWSQSRSWKSQKKVSSKSRSRDSKNLSPGLSLELETKEEKVSVSVSIVWTQSHWSLSPPSHPTQGYWSYSWQRVSHIVSCINRYCIYPASCNPILIRTKKKKMESHQQESQSRTQQPMSKGKGVPGANLSGMNY